MNLPDEPAAPPPLQSAVGLEVSNALAPPSPPLLEPPPPVQPPLLKPSSPPLDRVPGDFQPPPSPDFDFTSPPSSSSSSIRSSFNNLNLAAASCSNFFFIIEQQHLRERTRTRLSTDARLPPSPCFFLIKHPVMLHNTVTIIKQSISLFVLFIHRLDGMMTCLITHVEGKGVAMLEVTSLCWEFGSVSGVCHNWLIGVGGVDKMIRSDVAFVFGLPSAVTSQHRTTPMMSYQAPKPSKRGLSTEVPALGDNGARRAEGSDFQLEDRVLHLSLNWDLCKENINSVVCTTRMLADGHSINVDVFKMLTYMQLQAINHRFKINTNLFLFIVCLCPYES
ncbi:hypothetical protein LXL04_014412 [Taraxacum kok-saghyz]